MLLRGGPNSQNAWASPNRSRGRSDGSLGRALIGAGGRSGRCAGTRAGRGRSLLLLERAMSGTSATERERNIRQMQAEALSANGGNRSFKEWKAAAFDDVAQMALRAARMDLLRIDLRGDLDLVYRIAMPVPRRPVDGKLIVGASATFHLVYQDQWRVEPPPGWIPLGIIEPREVFHPNAREALRGALCLGDLPAGVAPKELV